MRDIEATRVCQLLSTLQAERSILDAHLQDIAELVRPVRADLLRGSTPRPAGEKRMQRVFDSTPLVAADNLAAGLWSGASGAADRWFTLEHPNSALNSLHSVKLWLSEVEKRIEAVLATDGNRFYHQALPYYADLVTLGTAMMWTEEVAVEGRVHFDTRPMHEVWIAEDDKRRVSTVVRRFRWSAHQIVRHYGDDAPTEAVKAVRANEPMMMFPIIHAVLPNDLYDPRAFGRRGKPFRSVHICAETEKVIRIGAFDEMPWLIARWATGSGSVYGDSPAMLALPDVKTLQASEKASLSAQQKAADPPLLAEHEESMGTIRVVPGGITYGGLENGRETLRPLASGTQWQVDIALTEQRRQAIRDAFYAGLLLMAPVANATATEVLARQEEKIRQMGPHLSRIQSEFLHPLILRVFRIMERANALPPPPPEMLEDPRFEVTYISPLARAQKAAKAGATIRALQQTLPLAQVNPDVVDNIDLDAAARLIFEAEGAPAQVLRDPEIVAQLRAARAEKAEAADRIQMTEGMVNEARAMRDVTQAAATAQAATGRAA